MASIQDLFHHLVLPAQIPASQDGNIDAISSEVVALFIKACRKLADLVDPTRKPAVQQLAEALEICADLHRRNLSPEALSQALGNLREGPPLILYIEAQNAAIIVRRSDQSDEKPTVAVEAFEAAPTNSAILQTENALSWEFPGRAVELPLDEFNNDTLQESITTFLSHASIEGLHVFAAKIRKADTMVVESRETPNPTLITEVLMPVLESMGSAIAVEVLHKHVRDDIRIGESDHPWRRLPFYLVLRVACQRLLCLSLGPEFGQACYKSLMALLLSDFLQHSIGRFHSEHVTIIKAKLCRRMAKLQAQITADESQELLSRVSGVVLPIVTTASESLLQAWNKFKKASSRHVFPIRRRADDSDFVIPLDNSGPLIHSLLSADGQHALNQAMSNRVPTEMEKFLQTCADTVAAEATRINKCQSYADSSSAMDCQLLADAMRGAINTCKALYSCDFEHNSALLLHLFELWVCMDRIACRLWPMLSEYRPPFSAQVLDSLHITSLSGLARLKAVQDHIHKRSTGATVKGKSILSSIDHQSFAVRFCAASTDLQDLQRRVEEAIASQRDRIRQTWVNNCREYDQLTAQMEDLPCTCSWDTNGKRIVKGCSRCYYWRARRDITTPCHEDSLPKDKTGKSAVIFELGAPKWWLHYRDLTWTLVRDFCYPGAPSQPVPCASSLVTDPVLKPYMAYGVRRIGLASAVKRFGDTHYRFTHGKAELSDILKPLAAVYEYRDNETSMWLATIDKPLTLQHLARLPVPKQLGSLMPGVKHPPPRPKDFESAEIQANQITCPPTISVHEYSAYQKIMSGVHRVWPNLLVELGSPNLTLSNEASARTYARLALQAGSMENGSLLRDMHAVFEDDAFVRQLLRQIQEKLKCIQENWREIHTMNLMTTLALWVYELTDNGEASTILDGVRAATLAWTDRLRKDYMTAADRQQADFISLHIAQAALVCRRTFFSSGGALYMNSAVTVSDYLRASLILQEHLPSTPAGLSASMKAALLRDIKLVSGAREGIKEAVATHFSMVGAAISQFWLDAGGNASMSFVDWSIEDAGRYLWANAVLRTRYASSRLVSQSVQCDVLTGLLLIGGQPQGNLPDEYTQSLTYKELFGSQNILTYPSNLPGMTYRVTNAIEGHFVHLGLARSKVIVKADHRDGLLQLVPREIFRQGQSFDLPGTLVIGRFHWLNLDCHKLVIRQSIWSTKPSDWAIDIRTGFCWRRNARLLGPSSAAFRQVTDVLKYFDIPERIVAFQREHGPLRVELKHLELSFFVNNSNRLECQELHAEVDTDQDIGTLYGLMSKLVMRNVRTGKRSVLIPLSELSPKLVGQHVQVFTEPSILYAKYDVDELLGRLIHPTDPYLAFALAGCHALTSSPNPDPLTGKTGGERALEILSAASSSPWTSLSRFAKQSLEVLKSLSPAREYYPASLQVHQRMTWRTDVTVYIQRDEYEGAVMDILHKSDCLSAFHHAEGSPVLSTYQPDHLRARGLKRRQLYERHSDGAPRVAPVAPRRYHPRDQAPPSKSVGRVFEIAKLLRSEPFDMPLAFNLVEATRRHEAIGGFNSGSMTYSLAAFSTFEAVTNLGKLLELCRHANDPRQMLFVLGLVAHVSKLDFSITKALVAMVRMPQLRQLAPPTHPAYRDLKHALPASISDIEALFKPAYAPYQTQGQMSKKQRQSAESRHRDDCTAEGERAARYLLAQWPDSNPELDNFNANHLDTEQAVDLVLPDWTHRLHNKAFFEYLDEVEKIIKTLPGAEKRYSISAHDISNNFDPLASASTDLSPIQPSLETVALALGALADKKIDAHARPLVAVASSRTPISASAIQKAPILNSVLQHMMSTGDAARVKYAEDLMDSLAACRRARIITAQDTHGDPTVDVVANLQSALVSLNRALGDLRSDMLDCDPSSQWLQLGGLWPADTLMSILKLVRSRSGITAEVSPFHRFISLALAVTAVQRQRRLRVALQSNAGPSSAEMAHPGHENWSPVQYPDWLLFEIDNDILVRTDQVNVAHAIISPESGANSVLQMNMGRGKTSCVVPMALAALADGRNLCRLIVPKALLPQTAQVLMGRVGGLIGRTVTHIPFFRKTPTAPDWIASYSALHEAAKHSGGAIIATPEQVLSFKLMCFQTVIDGDLKAGKRMAEVQTMLDDDCRDIIDESDSILSVKSQLIYPSGANVAVDGLSLRWNVIEDVLQMLEPHLPSLNKRFPHGIEIIARGDGYPLIQLLRPEAEAAVVETLINDICNNRLTQLRLTSSKSMKMKTLLCKVLTQESLEPQDFRNLIGFCAARDIAPTVLLVLRGLLTFGILVTCLKKRYNVQYGLHHDRVPLAVPYESKGVPSERAEFGHPDVALTLTCLATYYAGVTADQFKDSLRRILQSDDPASEWQQWTSQASPSKLVARWNTVNADDVTQVEALYKYLRFQRPVVDYALNNFVFPIHAKQFEVKIQASCYDLVLTRVPEENTCSARSTGFSGTNDNKMMLPENITQNDLTDLKGTNAEVLLHLLEDRNSSFFTTARASRRFTEQDLLEDLKRRGIRILIDAGAAILEMSNRDLVMKWLMVDHDAKAGLYFKADHRAWICRKKQEDIPLLASQFVNDLSEVVVYLDEAHCRGVDLQLPVNAKGALTVSIGQTKDQTVQAAMRLRKLGTSQCVAFFGAPEVEQSIRDACKLPPTIPVTSREVIAWLLEQTCQANQTVLGLHRAQGQDYVRRTDAQLRNSNYLHDVKQRDKLLAKLTLPERQCLEDMYGSKAATRLPRAANSISPELNEIARKLQIGGDGEFHAIHTSVLEEVEQEREIELEVEEERETQKPTRPEPLKFGGLQADIRAFALNGDGDAISASSAVMQVYEFVSKTAVGTKFSVRATASRLFVSTEFERTIHRTTKKHSADDFTRPVEYLLYSTKSETALIVTAEEAELLIRIIDCASEPGAHLIFYASPVTATMRHFAECHYYAKPELPPSYKMPLWLRLDLGIFSGQLYWDYDSCVALGDYLGIVKDEECADGDVVRIDGSDEVKRVYGLNGVNGVSGVNGAPVEKCTFSQDPVGFVLEWATLRRKNVDVLHLPLGYVCHGRPLDRDHAFFS